MLLMRSRLLHGPARTHALGALLAAAVSAGFLVACMALVFATRSPDGLFWPCGVAAVLCGIGVPVAALLGWVHTPTALAPLPPGLRIRLRHSLAGVSLALVAVSGLSAFATGPDSRLTLVAQPTDIVPGIGFALATGALMFGTVAVYGLLGLGLPSLLYGVLVETIWLRLLRRIVGLRPLVEHRPAPVAVAPLPRFTAVVTWLAIVGLALEVAAVMPAIAQLARANDPPGMLDGALLAWFLSLLAPGFIALVALRWRSRRLLHAAAPALLAVAIIVGMPDGLGLVAAAVAFGAAGLAACRTDPVGATRAIVVAALLLAAPAVLQATTETVCWDIYGEGIGLEIRRFPSEPNGPTEVPIVSAGCLDRAYSAVGAALGAGAIVLAGATAAAGDRLGVHPGHA
jgi:hypothetical protein